MKTSIISEADWGTATSKFWGMLPFNPEIKTAYVYADAAHCASGQIRKYTGAPYIEHPINVAIVLTHFGATHDQIAAALLHDVLEDTGVTEEDMEAHFNPAIIELVKEVTEPDDYHPGKRPKRSVRRAMEAERRKTISAEAQDLTCADSIANGFDIVDHATVQYARMYLRELVTRVTGMDKAKPALREAALALLNEQLERANAKYDEVFGEVA